MLELLHDLDRVGRVRAAAWEGDRAALRRLMVRLPAVLSGLLLVPLALAASAQDSATFEIERSAGRLVMQLVRTQTLFEGVESSVEVYGDGRVVVRHPRVHRRFGVYEANLSTAELDDLVRFGVERGLVEFDPSETRRQIDESAQARLAAATQGAPVVLRYTSDQPITTIELRFDRYAPRHSGPVRTSVVKRITWRGIHAESQRSPEVASLRDLEAVRKRLSDLMGDRRLVRVE